MISDKQWDDAYELSITNPKEAIKEYKLALETSGHPFLYTNIAAAYNELGDLKNSAIWYKKSESLLLTLEDKYSANPYANYAYFLYNKKDYKKALIFSDIAMEIDSDTMLFIENHVRILLALKKKEEAIPFLAKLRLIVPDWESVQDLLIDNQKDIDNYYGRFWDLKGKRHQFEEIIRLHDLDKDKLLKYIDSKKGSVPTIIYDKWDSIFKDMLNIGIEISDEYFIKLFKILIKSEEFLKLFNFLNLMIDNSKTGYLLILDLMKSANIKKKVVVNQLLKNVNSSNELELIEALSKNLIPSYKKELKEWIKELNSPISRVLFILVMQNTTPKYFKKEIQKYLENNIDSKKFNQILSRLEDEKLKEKLFNVKLSTWFNNNEILKDKTDFHKLIYKYILSTSKKQTNINSILQEYNNISKYDNYLNFWENFVKNFSNIKTNNVMYEKAFKLSLIFDPHTTISEHISFKNDIKTTLELLKANNIPIVFYLKYLIKDIHKKDDKGELIVEFITNYFNEVIEAFELISIKEKTSIIPIIWNYQKEKFTPILFDLANTNSKTIQGIIKTILKDETEFDDKILELLKARKASTRAIAVEILLSKKDKNLEPLLKEHAEKEKSESIKKLIKKILG